MKLDPEEIRRIAKITLDAKPEYVTCDDWIHMVGEYVEAAQSGADRSSERLRRVWEHARDCPPCMDELRALEKMMDLPPES